MSWAFDAIHELKQVHGDVRMEAFGLYFLHQAHRRGSAREAILDLARVDNLLTGDLKRLNSKIMMAEYLARYSDRSAEIIEYYRHLRKVYNEKWAIVGVGLRYSYRLAPEQIGEEIVRRTRYYNDAVFFAPYSF